jgi:hypothetical protein
MDMLNKQLLGRPWTRWRNQVREIYIYKSELGKNGHRYKRSAYGKIRGKWRFCHTVTHPGGNVNG